MLSGVDLTISKQESLECVNAAEWDALDHGPSPFLEHGFLRALEVSGSIGGESGWEPCHLLVRRNVDGPQGSGPLVGAVSAFVKCHSYGEYIFDFQWARASEGAGIPYYPKLVVAAPVTPATGARILLSRELSPAERRHVARVLIDAVRELAQDRGCRSVHWLFVLEEEQEWLRDAGFIPRLSMQYHFQNRDYTDFSDFLGRLSSRRRKQIRKERRRVADEVESTQFIPGDQIDPTQIAAMNRHYRSTTAAHGAHGYLQPGFFSEIVSRMPERVRFLEVKRGGVAMAGALYFETPDALYGRYWGCDEHVEFLHFEVACYRGIERCIEGGLSRFEAGAQGEHKLLRGFEPCVTRSAHWIENPDLHRAVEAFVGEERSAIGKQIAEVAGYGPYKKK